ncbi:hypothetical protein MNBD_ALPHA07-990 [hydrothermal vent metagenome]|uniref:RNase NYN domain-containing protein n=1 Tax=hydrothermal vent metagenome TaxID=652676 RepID=A0A3B0SII7_9ZZZZ
MSDHAPNPVTLGDKLDLQKGDEQVEILQIQRMGFLQILIITTTILLSAIITVLSWSTFKAPYPGLAAAIICIFNIIKLLPKRSRERHVPIKERHMLISADKQGFMSSLKLSDKTAILDGSNIYHFGLENRVGRNALKLLVDELRYDGYRVVCFFDANIYFTLLENGEFQQGRMRFSIRILQNIFDLKETEIYVVPKGIQADRFIIESLSLLPISFAVTNDRYRDYEAMYDFLSKDDQWRKGMKIKQGCLHLYQYKFQRPLIVA